MAPPLKTKPRTLRLDDARWAKLQGLGRGWLERAVDNAAPLSPGLPTYAELSTELLELRQLRARALADVSRVLAWLDSEPRRPAVLSFTEGPERQLAYRFEMLLSRVPA